MPHTHESRLAALRDALADEKLAGFIVPKADEFQNEAVPACWDRLAWLTGFTGSAGTAVVLADKAALIVDSRYTLQAKAQVDAALYTVELFPKVTLAKWLGEHAGEGAAIGYDPSLFTQASFKPLKAEAEKAGFELHPVKANPLDALWEDRPAPSFAPIVFHDEALAGESAASKLERVQKEIAARKATGLIVSAPDAVAWLFNVRGGDVAHTPVALARAYVPLKGKPTLFVSPGHLTDENREGLEVLAALHPLGDLWKVLPRLVGAAAKVIADPAYTTLRVADILKVAGAKVIEGDDPSIRFKAAKNATELEGARAAHLRDGVAVARFVAWLQSSAPSGTVDELAASDRLEAFRRETGKLVDLSFDTISGAGSNGAIVHYRATPETNKPLLPGTLYLIDSGGQYRDGTTDITRTVAIGDPNADMRRHYTLVLKGHIGIATARFPAKTTGAALDSFARRALWDAGLDYGHGTGHGVGSFLSVHEGPANISPRGTVALEPGMILSNEPGYYREGQYGIRLENLVAVTPAQGIDGGETEMLGFETLTLAPFDRRLIDAALLSPAERDWLNAYHARVREALAPHLDDADRAWLDAATAEI
ncbi:peptidase M24 [Rhodomicrobium vannielii ATCC 17100]|uniref:Peptidase M24 n=1 Tax=Rhodomicrobium vannielii (strain ATCC 17100 / DSM 162 / LMG 4299 / NCIMB 10020 / ATH 3.1.1) TaxID=648757 RepID=E3I0F7_RHOVT|nr:aminopeptidase P family protein [Rhodomicrobium vannielii]ADP72275.1 peptidase M24 [Rhodomicrobium vannielii ATCC 17100]